MGIMAKPSQNLNIFRICIRNPYRASLVLLLVALVLHAVFLLAFDSDWNNKSGRTETCSKCGGVVRFSTWDHPPRRWFSGETRSVEVSPASDCQHVWHSKLQLDTKFWGGGEDPKGLAVRPFFLGSYAGSALLFIYGLVGTARRGKWP